MKMLEPSEIKIPTFDLVTEQQVRDYIMYRYLITSRFDELVKRWGPGGPVFWMSGSRVFQEFREREAQQGINLLRFKGLQRDVEIDWIAPIARSVWQIQFRTLDYYPNATQADVTIWRATLRVGYASINYPDKNYAMRNPFGFVVKTYSLAYHGKDTTSSHYLEEARKSARKRRGL
jgi:type IV secretory pathway component VirB8